MAAAKEISMDASGGTFMRRGCRRNKERLQSLGGQRGISFFFFAVAVFSGLPPGGDA